MKTKTLIATCVLLALLCSAAFLNVAFATYSDTFTLDTTEDCITEYTALTANLTAWTLRLNFTDLTLNSTAFNENTTSQYFDISVFVNSTYALATVRLGFNYSDSVFNGTYAQLLTDNGTDTATIYQNTNYTLPTSLYVSQTSTYTYAYVNSALNESVVQTAQNITAFSSSNSTSPLAYEGTLTVTLEDDDLAINTTSIIYMVLIISVVSSIAGVGATSSRRRRR